MGLLTIFSQRYNRVKRYNQIISVLLKYGFEDFVSYLEEKKRFAFLKKLIPKSTLSHSIKFTKWEKMRMVCEELGPTFVKFGQILSNRPDLLPADLIFELEKLQDNVPPVKGTIAVNTIEIELKKSIKEHFSYFEDTAFASASMAQVHKATLLNGEKVVVKVQRPGIREVIDMDIRVMLYIAGIFNNRIPSLKSFDPVGLVRNFEESIKKELDFITESISLQRFQNNFMEDEKYNGEVFSPKVYAQLSTSKVLTMEMIDGIKISNIHKLDAAGYDRKIIANRLAHSFFKQVFDYGFFHADPHPGNLIVVPGNKICFIDYGMMGSIMKKDIEQFGYLFMAVNKKDVRRIIRSLQLLSDNPVIKNFRRLEMDLNEFVHNYAYRNNISENELSTMLLELKDIIVKHGLKVPTHFFLLARALFTVEGVIRSLHPDIELTQMLRPYLIKTIAKHYNPVQFTKRVLNSIYEMGMYMEDFPRDIKNAIRKINTGEIKVDLRHKGIDPLVHTINRVSKQIISAVIISGLIIGGSLLLMYNIGPLWKGISALGIIGFIVAAILLLGLLKDVKKGDHDDWEGWQN